MTSPITEADYRQAADQPDTGPGHVWADVGYLLIMWAVFRFIGNGLIWFIQPLTSEQLWRFHADSVDLIATVVLGIGALVASFHGRRITELRAARIAAGGGLEDEPYNRAFGVPPWQLMNEGEVVVHGAATNPFIPGYYGIVQTHMGSLWLWCTDSEGILYPVEIESEDASAFVKAPPEILRLVVDSMLSATLVVYTGMDAPLASHQRFYDRCIKPLVDQRREELDQQQTQLAAGAVSTPEEAVGSPTVAETTSA